MNQRANYLIQILDKIGGPLMQVVAETRASKPEESDEGDAKTIASLLGKVVEVSISLNQILDLNTQDAQDDSLRVALAALAGPLVGGQFKRKGEVPNDADLKKIQTALQAVLTFGDNFTPSAEHIERLKKIEAEGTTIDANQINIQSIHAFIPVVNAVGAFSFGQPEQKLITDISSKLSKHAIEMRESILPELSDDEQKLAELGILRALAQIYAACHTAETQRLASLKDQAPAGSGMETVWKSFDTRTAMLEALVRNILPKSTGGTSPAPLSSAPPPVAPQPIEPVAPIPQDHAPVPQEPAPPPTIPESSPPENSASAAGGGPMSFFSTPGESPAETPPAAPAPQEPPPAANPPPAAPPTTTTPQDTQQSGNPMSFFGAPGGDAAPPTETPQPPPTPTEAPPPATQPVEKQDEQSGGDDNGGGNPMSFFKKGD